jgi:hypothetical protein
MAQAVKRAQILNNSVLLSILILSLMMLPIIQITHGATSSGKNITVSGSIAQTEQTTYVGVSSIARQQGTRSPYALSSIDEVIAVMNAEHLNIWRMSLEPDFNDWQTFIQYYLDNCPYDLMNIMTSEQWQQATQRCLQILAAFPNDQDRIWIEPQNEQKTDITAQTQAFVTAVRNAGFTNNIVSNVFWRPESGAFAKMATINDPLDKFWTGQHYYVNQFSSESRIKELMNEGLNAGCKLINTEVGADAMEIDYFDQSEVDRLNAFLQWCADRGIGNCVWLMYGDYDYPTYQNLGLEFPAI